MFLVRTEKPCSSSRPYNLTSTASSRRVKDACLGTAKRREASLMRLDGDGHAGRRRGRFLLAKLSPMFTGNRYQLPGESIGILTIGLCCKVPVPETESFAAKCPCLVLQSARG
jgi:hypothetical protein